MWFLVIFYVEVHSFLALLAWPSVKACLAIVKFKGQVSFCLFVDSLPVLFMLPLIDYSQIDLINGWPKSFLSVGEKETLSFSQSYYFLNISFLLLLLLLPITGLGENK